MPSCGIACDTSKIIRYCSKGNISAISDAVERNQCCSACCNKNKDTLLIVAAKFANLNVVKLLLEQFGLEYIEQFNKTGKRALHEAAQNGQYDIAKYLLDNGATVDALKQGDWTPTMLAAEKGHFEMVQLLGSYGADPSLRNKDGWNTLHIAARTGDIDILQYLYNQNQGLISTVSKNGRRPLHSAALNNSADAVLWLARNGAEIDVEDSSGMTPLMDGGRMGHLAVCQVLLQRGADILRRDGLGRTILHHVAQAGQVEMIQWCVDNANSKINNMVGCSKPEKSFINWQSTQGSTALHYAAKESRGAEISKLVSLDADILIRDNHGRLPVDMTPHENIKEKLMI